MFPADLDELSDTELVATFRQLETEHRQLQARRAQLVEAMDRRDVYRIDGHSSIHGLVRAITRCPTPESKRLLRTGKLLHRYAQVTSAAAAGKVGVAQLSRMAQAAEHPRCGDQFDDVVDFMVSYTEQLKYSEFNTLIGRWETITDTDGANQNADASHTNRDAWIAVFAEGFHGQLRGSTLMGTAMLEILDRFIQIEWDRDWQWTKTEYGNDACPAKMPRTHAQRRADAMYAIFHAAVAVPADAKTPEPVVNLLGDPVTFCRVLAIYFGVEVAPEQDAAAEQLVPFKDRRCETSTGIPVAPNELLAAALVGCVRRAVIDSRSVVIDLGRKQRLFTGDARAAAHLGRSRCYQPGCEVPANRCHTDHLTNWHHGGTTSPDDGEPCCPHHNWLKQNRRYTTRRDEHGRIHTHRPDGTEIT